MRSTRSLFVLGLLFIGVSCSSSNPQPIDTVDSTDIQGKWSLACSPNSQINPQRAYWVSDDTITSDSLVSVAKYYEDSSCTITGSPQTRLLRASLSFPGGSTTTQLGSAKHMNTVIQTVEYDGVALTEGSGESIYEAIGAAYHDIYLVLDNTLYYGRSTAERNGLTSQTRFNELSQLYPYQRQD